MKLKFAMKHWSQNEKNTWHIITEIWPPDTFYRSLIELSSRATLKSLNLWLICVRTKVQLSESCFSSCRLEVELKINFSMTYELTCRMIFHLSLRISLHCNWISLAINYFLAFISKMKKMKTVYRYRAFFVLNWLQQYRQHTILFDRS